MPLMLEFQDVVKTSGWPWLSPRVLVPEALIRRGVGLAEFWGHQLNSRDRSLRTRIPGRVTQGGFPPRVPTDPACGIPASKATRRRAATSPAGIP